MATLKDRIEKILTEGSKKTKKIEKVDTESKETLKEYNKMAKGILEAFRIKDEILGKILDEIDKEQKILRPVLRWFTGLMEEDLRKNDFKGGWLDGELGYYRGKALKHLTELEDIDSMKFETPTSKKNAIEHCAKAANYLMMLAHNLIEELMNDETGKKGDING